MGRPDATFAALINVRGKSVAWIDLMFSFLFQTAWAMLVICWARRAWHDLREPAEPGAKELVIAVMVLVNVAVYLVFV